MGKICLDGDLDFPTCEITSPTGLLTKLKQIAYELRIFFFILKSEGVSFITYLCRTIFRYHTTKACEVFLHNAVGNVLDCF